MSESTTSHNNHFNCSIILLSLFGSFSTLTKRFRLQFKILVSINISFQLSHNCSITSYHIKRIPPILQIKQGINIGFSRCPHTVCNLHWGLCVGRNPQGSSSGRTAGRKSCRRATSSCLHSHSSLHPAAAPQTPVDTNKPHVS